MCLAVIALSENGDFPVVVIHNRDEFFARDTEKAALHSGAVYARDVSGGGTFMGLHLSTGRLAMLTNVRPTHGEQKPELPKSRGDLVRLVLEGQEAPVMDEGYTGFRLWHGNVFTGSLHVAECVPGADGWDRRASPQPLGPGVHAQSNEPGAEVWPKTAWATEAIHAALQGELSNATEVRDAVAAALCSSITLEAGVEDSIVFSKSMAPTWFTRVLQEGPFVSAPRLDVAAADNGADAQRYGTRTQTVVVSCARTQTVVYSIRDFDDRGNPGPWADWSVPWPSTL